MRIDAHHHLWRYVPEEFEWIGDREGAIRRDFLLDDLRPALRAAGVDGTVAVQARQRVEETDWLLGLAHEHDVIRGVVGWVPLASPSVGEVLERVADDPALVGVRHVLHDEVDDRYMLRPDFDAGVARLRDYGLVYDLLVFERHLPQTIEFVDRHPDQPFVLDHAAKPRIAAGELEPWRTHLAALAEREHCVCKVSGLVTEADRERWTPDDLRPYWDTVLDAFGAERLLFGSDWPVCRLASSYARWVQTVEGLAASLSDAENARLFGGTAAEVYGLPPPPDL